jgi:hypothetical protein
MARKRDKFGMLMLGTFIGIIAGVSIMWWGASLKQTEWISFRSIRTIINNLLPGKDDQLSEIKTPFEENKGKRGGKTSGKQGDTIIDGNKIDSLYLIDSLNEVYATTGGADNYFIDETSLPDTLLWYGRLSQRQFKSDSLKADSLSLVKRSSTKNEIIKRDMFIGFKMLKVIGKSDSLDRKSAYLDSLLTDDKLAQSRPHNQYRVELWKSPINYQGYRLYPNKIIIYGIEKFDQLGLELLNKKLILKNLNTYYLLEQSDNYRPLRPVKKSEILKITKE